MLTPLHICIEFSLSGQMAGVERDQGDASGETGRNGKLTYLGAGVNGVTDVEAARSV